MKKVDFTFKNIQSHKLTSFSLEPGLNFILSPKNNVGKSTIFKAISVMARMPSVSKQDLAELLRTNENSGYIVCSFDDIKIVFWIVKDNDRYNAFFEERIGDSSVRSLNCPKSLIEALDLYIGTDGELVNFNNADSVQLVVEDSNKTDELLAKILIDDTVELVKQNLVVLDRNVLSDNKVISARYEDCNSTLKSLEYVSVVEDFKSEERLLTSACKVMDILDVIDFEAKKGLSYKSGDLNLIDSGLKVLQCTDTLLSFIDVSKVEIDLNDMDLVLRGSKVYNYIKGLNVDLLSRKPVLNDMVIYNIAKAIKVYNSLSKCCYIMANIEMLRKKIQTSNKDIEHLVQDLNNNCEIVKCPVKGDVYYGSTCISVSD